MVNYKLVLLLLVFLMPLGLAADDTYKQSTEVNLKYFCQQENGVDCDASAVCNLTVLSPAEAIIVQSGGMTNQGAFHNYSLNDSQTSIVGTHTAKLVCQDTPLIGYETFTFEITPSGTTTSTTQGLLYIALLGLGVVFFCFALYGTVKIPWKNTRHVDGTVMNVNDLKYLKLFLFFMSYTLLIFISWTGWKIGDFFLYFDVGHKVFSSIFWVLIVFLVPLFILTGLTGIMAFFHDKKLKNLMTRGLNPR